MTRANELIESVLAGTDPILAISEMAMPVGKVQQAIMTALQKAQPGAAMSVDDISKMPQCRGVHYAQITSGVAELKKKGLITGSDDSLKLVKGKQESLDEAGFPKIMRDDLIRLGKVVIAKKSELKHGVVWDETEMGENKAAMDTLKDLEKAGEVKLVVSGKEKAYVPTSKLKK